MSLVKILMFYLLMFWNFLGAYFTSKTKEPMPSLNSIELYKGSSEEARSLWGNPDRYYYLFNEMIEDSTLILVYGKSEFSFCHSRDGKTDDLCEFEVRDSVFVLSPFGYFVGMYQNHLDTVVSFPVENCDCVIYATIKNSKVTSIRTWTNW